MKQLRFKNDYGNEFPEPEEMALGDIAERIRRKASPDSTAPVMMISAGNGFIYQSDRYSRDNAGTSLKNYTLLKKGELAYNHGYSKIRNFGSCFVLNVEDEARVPYVYHTFRLPEDNPYYFGEYLNCGLYDSALKGLVSSSVRMDGLLNISYDDYMSLSIMRPSKEEQDKVTDFLSLYNKKIENQMAKVEALETRRKGLLQQIFSQEIRFKADDGSEFPDWEPTPFGDVIEPFTIKTKTENEDTLLSCAIEGMFLNSELFDHQRGASNKGYLKIKMGTLILSAQNLHLGNANVNLRFEHGIISPAYKTYNVTGCLPEFMGVWVKREAAKKFFYDATTTGASQCRRNVDWDKLYSQEMDIPCEAEQRKISAFVTLVDKQIQIEKDKLEAIKQVKKGLLQQMFV